MLVRVYSGTSLLWYEFTAVRVYTFSFELTFPNVFSEIIYKICIWCLTIPYLALRQNYNIYRKNSKRRSVSTIVKIKTIHGGHLVIIIHQFIGKSFLFYWAEWLSNIIYKFYKLFQKKHLGKLNIVILPQSQIRHVFSYFIFHATSFRSSTLF
jgi:hypothetical protein